jgi:hypothetical protein
LYSLSTASYEKEWGKEYQRPGIFARFMATLFRVVPKVGPFKSVNFKAPTARTETLFMQSFNASLALYKTLLESELKGQVTLPNRDFDTGKATAAGEYSLADETYAKLLTGMAKTNFSGITPELRANLLTFYQDPTAFARAAEKNGKKKDTKDAAETVAALEQLKNMSASGSTGASGAPVVTPAVVRQ